MINKKTDAYRIIQDRKSNMMINRVKSLLALMENNTSSFINWDNVRSCMIEALDVLELQYRWSELEKNVVITLNYDKLKLICEGHEFDNLDEVEKAINMKAFL